MSYVVLQDKFHRTEIMFVFTKMFSERSVCGISNDIDITATYPFQ